MMETVWIALGGNAAFLLVVAFLGKRIIQHWLDKDLGQFKQKLTDAAAGELEKLNHKMQIATNEHSILLARLQDRRAMVVDEIYTSLAIGMRELESYLRPLQLAGEDDQRTKADRARNALIAALNCFDERQIWLTADCAGQVKKVMELLRSTFNEFDISRQDAERDGGRIESRAWLAAWDRINGPGGEARATLEAEMRKLLEPVRPI